MYIQNKLIKENFIYQYLLFFIIIILPQIFFYEDLWDGTIYNYAQQINEFDGAKLQLYEPGWVLNYWFVFIIIKIANILNFEYYTLYILFLSLLYLFFLIEIKNFIKNFFFKNRKLISRILFLISIFSIQSYYYSSIMLWHLFCQFSILYGIRKFYSSNLIDVLIALFFLFIAFSYKSALLYIFVIGLYYNENKIFNKKYFFLILYGFSIFIFFHYYLNNFGRAENYAQILNPLKFENFLILIKSAITYITFLIPLGLLTFFFVIKIIFKKQKVEKKEIFNFILKNKYLIILIITGIVPYVAIGRSHVVWDVEDWAGRNAILLILPISCLSIITIEFFYKLNVITKKISFYCFIFLLTVNLFFLTKGVTAKLNRIIYQNELSSIIIANKNLLNEPSGILVFIDKNKIRPIFRINEINYLTYKSLGKNNLWSIYMNDFDENLINYPKDRKYKNLYLSNFYSDKNLKSQCLIIMKLSSNKLVGIKNKITNIFYKDYFQINLENIEKKNCN